MRKLTTFFARPAPLVARELIGARLWLNGIGGEIVETEAYEAHDPASHSFRGLTARNASMFGPPAHAYVYRIYGLHWCFNMVAERGSAVLIRALEPLDGLDVMAERRRAADPKLLCSGLGRLCEALAITGAHDGLPLAKAPFELTLARKPHLSIAAARIGVREAVPAPLRFCKSGSPYLSRKPAPMEV